MAFSYCVKVIASITRRFPAVGRTLSISVIEMEVQEKKKEKKERTNVARKTLLSHDVIMMKIDVTNGAKLRKVISIHASCADFRLVCCGYNYKVISYFNVKYMYELNIISCFLVS